MPEAATRIVQILQHRMVKNYNIIQSSNITTPHGQKLQHHTKFKYYNTAWSKTTTSYKVQILQHRMVKDYNIIQSSNITTPHGQRLQHHTKFLYLVILAI
jgi:hypothetical protein